MHHLNLYLHHGESSLSAASQRLDQVVRSFLNLFTLFWAPQMAAAAAAAASEQGQRTNEGRGQHNIAAARPRPRTERGEGGRERDFTS